MKRFWLLIICILFGLQSFSQQTAAKKVYHPEADASKAIADARKSAAKNKKHIMIFVGGNWCTWCMRLDRFLNEHDSLKTFLNEYEVVHVNYSKENKNEKVLHSLQEPQRFGFPVIVILNEKGQQIMTQNTSFLEQGNGYSAEKIADFLKIWTYKKINP
ncbi:thiol:disulfide interchange protein precursor [compost metagenome]